MYIFCTRTYWVHYPYWLTKQISCQILQYSFLKVKLYMEIHFWYSSVLHVNITHGNMAKIIVKHFLPLFKCSDKAVLPQFHHQCILKTDIIYILYAVFVWNKKKKIQYRYLHLVTVLFLYIRQHLHIANWVHAHAILSHMLFQAKLELR